MHAPCPTNIRSQPQGFGFNTLHKLFVQDSLKQIKAGEAGTFRGEYEGKAFRVVKALPYQDMLIGYIFTQNGKNS